MQHPSPPKPSLAVACSGQPHLLTHPQARAVLVLFLLLFPWAGPGLPLVWEGHPYSHFSQGSRVPTGYREYFPQGPTAKTWPPSLRARSTAAAGRASCCAHGPSPEAVGTIHSFLNKPLPEALSPHPTPRAPRCWALVSRPQEPLQPLPDSSCPVSCLNTQA